MSRAEGHFKDRILDRIAAQEGNAAQFVSFGPDLRQAHAWIRGYPPNHRFASVEEAVGAILGASPESSVNIRSYLPSRPKSLEFLYGLRRAGEVLENLRRMAGDGLYTIVNETVDVDDGGVSGVAFGDVLEFAPDDTPRCVEKPGSVALPRNLGLQVLTTVYGFRPALPEPAERRVEFSIHPLRRGYRHEHTILWEVEETGPAPIHAEIVWPNRFSRYLGDKAFGLLIADALGLRVPRTQVIPRKLAPFTFGIPTGLAESWIRTCPVEQVPGLFTTSRGWLDPYRLMAEEDPGGERIASLLCQEGIDAQYSGALVAQADGEPLIEGVAGHGDEFMTGKRAPEEIPREVVKSLLELYQHIRGLLGPVRFEWVHDGTHPWVVQLHRGASLVTGRVVVPGEAPRFHRLEVAVGIDALRQLIAQVEGSHDGIILVGKVGVTSHFGDLLRRAKIPSRIEDAGEI